VAGEVPRVFSTEEKGDYFVGFFMGGTLPTGDSPNGTGHAVLSPTFAAAEGLGKWDIQSTIGASLPLSGTSTLGRTLIFNFRSDFVSLCLPAGPLTLDCPKGAHPPPPLRFPHLTCRNSRRRTNALRWFVTCRTCREAAPALGLAAPSAPGCEDSSPLTYATETVTLLGTPMPSSRHRGNPHQ
jgi:hypothetical protein